MKNLDRIIERLRRLEHDFYGRVEIRFRGGRAVTMTEERSTRLDEHDTHEDASALSSRRG